MTVIKPTGSPESRHANRLFWLVCVLLSWYGSLYLIRQSWTTFQNNPINFGVETTYLEWNTQFPSVVVCEVLNVNIVAAHTEKLFSNIYDEDDPLYDRRFDIEEVFGELAFYEGSSYNLLKACIPANKYGTETGCPTGNYSEIANLFRMNCADLFHFCRWNDKPFDCCKYFLPLETEYGMCYAINNLNTRIQRHFEMISNQSTGPGFIYLQFNTHATVYVLSEEDVPHFSIQETDKINTVYGFAEEFYIKINRISNQEEVHDVDIPKRSCRFPNENYINIYPVYSVSACLVNCRRNLQLQLCNCTSYYMPNGDPKLYCDINGLFCLEGHINTFIQQKVSENSTAVGYYCHCVDGCESMTIEYVRWVREMHQLSPSGKSELKVILDHLPTELFKRTVVRGKLDLVVSMGGATGLFVGASLLSFIELVYYFTLRLFVTVKYMKNKHRPNDVAPQQAQVMNSMEPQNTGLKKYPQGFLHRPSHKLYYRSVNHM
ncbi:sodium channel protein Nach isoform X2 [Zootermopsis nevadensis]|uniref:sodium channel protein Nach isoform X2 n=1 Tax=Zootermopsis nevadensis TaxID=136037 RepID=UPI000B8EC64D|nr:sodium channel protein Nach isoform X2 [Zootermopsis nevadensis]